MEYRILDLFSGAGGFSYGFDSVDGFETVVATDFNRNALETFKYNFPNTKTIFGDILDKDIKAHFSLARDNIINPSSMWRHSSIKALEINYAQTATAPDFHMWVQCALHKKTFANLPEPLLLYRLHPGQKFHRPAGGGPRRVGGRDLWRFAFCFGDTGRSRTGRDLFGWPLQCVESAGNGRRSA